MKTRSTKWLTRLGSPLLLLLVLVLVVVVRGTWASADPKNPISPEDGVTCQLFEGADGRKVVRAAVVLNQPLENVWPRLANVEQYPEMFTTIHNFQIDPAQPNRVKIDVQTFWGMKHLEGKMKREDSGGKHVLTFEDLQGGADVHLLRLTLTGHGEKQSLLVYEVDADVPGYPTFLVRNVFRSRNAAVLRMIRDYFDQYPNP